MMDRRTLLHLAAILLPLVFLLGWTACLSWRHAHSETYQVVVGGYDPRDIVYGKYVQIRYEWDHPDSQKPHGDNKLPVSGRFYVPEYSAFDLQEMLRDSATNKFVATVVVFGSKAHIKNLTINGMGWQEALDAWRETKHNQGQ